MPSSSPIASVPPSGLSAIDSDRIAVALQDADRCGLPRSDGGRWSGWRSSRPARRRAGEKKRLVEPILAQGLRAEALRVGSQSGVAGVATLVERQTPAAIATASAAHAGDQQRSQAAVRAGCARPRLRSPGGSLQELALESVELLPVLRLPVQGGCEPGAAVEPPRSRPPASQSCAASVTVAVKPPSLGVSLEPAAQPRPFPQQRLVRDLDLPLAHSDQPAPGQPGQHPAPRSSRSRSSSSSATRRRTTASPSPSPARRSRIRRATSRAVRSSPVGRLGEPCDRSLHASRSLVGREPQPAAVAVLPQLQERRREEGEPTSLAGHVLDEPVTSSGSTMRPAFLAGPSMVRARSSAASGRQPRGSSRAAARGVDAPRRPRSNPRRGKHEHDWAVVALRSVHEGVDVLDPFLVVAVSREHLLELVHREHHPLIRLEPVQRPPQVAIGLSPGRITTCRQLSLPGRRRWPSERNPARKVDDLPLPEGPTRPSRSAPTRRATISATSRSRPRSIRRARSRTCEPLERADRHGVVIVRVGNRPERQGGPRVHGVQVHDISGQLGLDRSQLPAPRGRAARGGVASGRGGADR